MAPTYIPPKNDVARDLAAMNSEEDIRSRDRGTYDDALAEVSGYENWSSQDLANYFANKGLGEYREVIMYHRITGGIAPHLTDNDMKDMGIKIVGDRCRFRKQIVILARKARAVQRTKVIWEAREKLFFGACDACVGTCCGLFPEDPSTYRLTESHLKVRLVEPNRCGPITCMCCTTYSVNNVDMTYVNDVDLIGVPAPFLHQVLCCAEGKEIVDINSTNEGKIYLTLNEGEGERAAQMIMNQIEEAQIMERD